MAGSRRAWGPPRRIRRPRHPSPLLNRGGHFAATQPNTSYAVAATIEGDPPAGHVPGHRHGRPLRAAACRRFDNRRRRRARDRPPPGQRAPPELLGGVGSRRVPGRFGDPSVVGPGLHSGNPAPLGGRIPSVGVPVYTATGFAKWGMTNGTVAARILCDLVTGRSPSVARAHRAVARRPRSVPRDAPFQRRGGGRFVGDRIGGSHPLELDAIHPVRAAVGMVDGRRVAAHRDREGISTCSMHRVPISVASSVGTQRKRVGTVHVMARASPPTAASSMGRRSSPWRGCVHCRRAVPRLSWSDAGQWAAAVCLAC